MLPVSLLMAARGHPMLVEIKTGETYNGILEACDTWMNIKLKEVICTSPDGDKFWRLPETFIKGSTIKYLRIPDEVVDKAKEYQARYQSGRGRGRGRGARMGSRGRGRDQKSL